MASIWAGITATIGYLITSIGTVMSAVLAYDLVQIVLGVIVFGLALGLVFSLVRKIKTRG